MIFIIATTGEGDPPESMLKSWKFLLRKDLPSNSLKALNFSTFGLGDSSYELFNVMAKKLTQRLIDLGASIFHEMALGDYQHDFEYRGEFDPWMDTIWDKLGEPSLKPVEKLQPLYSVKIVGESKET